ncbi:MAG TPA: crossover junction endodeoxyribonuclease RuvC [Candidatus Paceibacterota bacterium]|nr:crossover junction endodeoxyribonuclease RuvC [Candidatus Paceibacterota bacterium]
MIALGIDPGTRRIGYGVVECNGPAIAFVAAGILEIKTDDDVSALEETKKGIDALIKKHRPDVVAVEKIFFAKNTKTALAVAQARGVIMLATKERGVRIKEYTPNEVKSGVAGYGFADKKAVLKMVRLILGKKDLAVIDDASDALALAILSTGDRLLDSTR